MERYKALFQKLNIEFSQMMSFCDVRIHNGRLLGELTFIPKSVIVFLIPYYAHDDAPRNISLYSVPKDYHLFAEELFSKLVPELEKIYPGGKFKGFCDHSPISEVHAAACAGLGVIGDNGLLINRKYGSFVFIAEVLCDIGCDVRAAEIKRCAGCGKCRELCPAKDGVCLSRLTQKKGALAGTEEAAVAAGGCAWGCDICQLCCPMNRSDETPIEFFKNERIPFLDTERLLSMSDEEFSKRAYSWKGRATVERNLRILKNTKG